MLEYTGVDPAQEFGKKKEELQASIGAREPRTDDPGSLVLSDTGQFEMINQRVTEWDHRGWAVEVGSGRLLH